MSASNALDLITKRMKALLEDVRYLGPNMVTTKPLDKAVVEDAVAGSVNLFLYQTTINSAWRNQDFPSPRRGQPGRGLLPLNLYFLLTAFGTSETDENAHVALGKAMLAFHEHPDLAPNHPGWNQIDAAHIALQPLNLDEMSKLWSAFQASYRLSVAYEVSTVLIESGLEKTAALPVRKLGEDERGWKSTTQFPPQVERIKLTDKTRPGLIDGDQFTIFGRDLLADGALSIGFEPVNRKLLETAAIAAPRVLAKSPDRIVCEADDNPAGVYLVSVRHTTIDTESGTHTATSNAVPVAVLPLVFKPTIPLRIVEFTDNENQRKYRVRLECEAPKAEQRCEVLVGSQSFPAKAVPEVSSTTFIWPARKIILRKDEKAYVRVQIDGVESVIPQPPLDAVYVAELPGGP